MVLTCLSEQSSALFGYDDLTDADPAEVAALQCSGLLQEVGYAGWVTCEGCDKACREEVVLLDDEPGQTRAYVACQERDEIGRVEVPLDRLRQWQATGEGLARVVAGLLGTDGKIEECVRGRLWWLGRPDIAGRRADVFVACGLTDDADTDEISECKRLRECARPFVLLPALREETDWLPGNGVTLSLLRLLSVSEGEMDLDRQPLEEALPATSEDETPAEPLLVIAEEGLEVTYAGQKVYLTPTERKVFIALAQQPGRPLPYFDLDQAGWDGALYDFSSIRAVIAKIRGKLAEAAESAGLDPQEAREIIHTRRGRHGEGSAYELTLSAKQVVVY